LPHQQASSANPILFQAQYTLVAWFSSTSVVQCASQLHCMQPVA